MEPHSNSTMAAEGTDTAEVLDFAYDAQGTPYSLTYTNGTASPVVYYYITNLQGDVTYPINNSGTKVASYSYDPYGKITCATGTMAQINPLRYRGYYYDNESSFYYLQSRYYDAAICRFINADSYTNTGKYWATICLHIVKTVPLRWMTQMENFGI